MPQQAVHPERSPGFFRGAMEQLLPQPGLTPDDRLYIWISCASAGLDDEFLEAALHLSLTRGLPVVQIKEVILQNYLFCGFPVAIEALSILARVRAGLSIDDSNADDPRDEASQIREGQALCRRVYEDNFDRLMRNMEDLSHDLQAWMIREGYGKVLSRPVLPILPREFCIIAALVTTHRPRQLHSHLRGACNVGATRPQLESVLDAIRPFVPVDHTRSADQLLENLS